MLFLTSFICYDLFFTHSEKQLGLDCSMPSYNTTLRHDKWDMLRIWQSSTGFQGVILHICSISSIPIITNSLKEIAERAGGVHPFIQLQL